jgi:hypothetical protein
MRAVNPGWGVMLRARGARAASLALALALATGALLTMAATAGAELVRVGDIGVRQLARAIKRDPVALAGHPDPTLSRGHVSALRSQIANRDPGRIRIAVVSPLTQQASGDLSTALSNDLNGDGVVIVVAGGNYHVTTTWGTGDQAQSILADAVGQQGASLYVQMRRAVAGFAKADAAAGHPSSSAAESETSTAQPAPAASGSIGGAGPSTSASSNGGLIVGLVALAVVLVFVLTFGGRRLRASRRAAHRREQIATDAREQAQRNLSRLGEDIEALDIDSSMPNASPRAKDQYSKAIDCYQDAERRLAKGRDSYQFEKGQDALKRGHAHVQAAGELFGGADESSVAIPRDPD